MFAVVDTASLLYLPLDINRGKSITPSPLFY